MRINYIHQTVSCAEKSVVAQNQVEMDLISYNSASHLRARPINRIQLCPCICLSVCLSVYLYICLLVCLFVCLFVDLFVCFPPVNLLVCLSICLFVGIFVCLSICPSVCFSLYLSICLFVCLFVFLFLSSKPEARPPAGHPRRAWAFEELRRYHPRPSRFNWGPENVHFGKTHSRDLNINTRFFIYFFEI